ncbi:MAG: TetR/AcrR family transcriptional regulator [Thermoleophilia bacterium]
MGRPRTHDEHTRVALLDVAERIVEEDGLAALSVRAAAAGAGTTTRAVYSLFGSKEGLLVALSARAFEILNDGLDAQRSSGDPVADLVAAGTEVFRGLVREHPWLYRLAFQRAAPGLPLPAAFEVARWGSFARVEQRVRRIEDAGLLGDRTVRQAAVEFQVVCEGLANAELRGGTLRQLAPADAGRAWADAHEAMIRGWAVAG